jgi:hypothetical protein
MATISKVALTPDGLGFFGLTIPMALGQKTKSNGLMDQELK